MCVSWIATFYKWGLLTLAGFIAAALLWRGHTHVDPGGATVLVPMMCAVAAVVVLLTALSMAFRGDDAPAPR